MVQLSNQCALLFLCALARGDVNVDAHCASRAAVAVVRNENTRLDPTILAPRSNNSIFPTIFVPPLTVGAASERFRYRTRSSGCTPSCHSLRAISVVPSGKP